MRRLTATASLDGTVIASTERAVRVEGAVYFPAADVSASLQPSLLTTLCFWKGIARYRHVEAGRTVRHAAWTYPLPSPLAWPLRGMVAFDEAAGILVRTERRDLA